MMKHSMLFLSVLSVSQMMTAQEFDWAGFENLIDKTWHAEEYWDDGGHFKQTVTFSYDLEGTIVIAKSQGYVDEHQTVYGDRNHGIRKWDAANKQFTFYEFDVFGGVTTGTIRFEGKNIIYSYEYGGLHLEDRWTYLDDRTYRFEVVSVSKEGDKTYLSTTFREVTDE